jgi:hypothetical protein
MAVRRGRRTGRFGMRSILLSPPGPTTGVLARGARRTGPPPDRVRVAACSRRGTAAAWAAATLPPVKGRSCAGSECASRRRSPPDTRPRPHSTRSDGPSTPTRRVRRSGRGAGWARVERFGSSDELGQHPGARGIREEAATMPQPTALSRRSTASDAVPQLDFRSARCGRQSANTIHPAGAAKIAAASRLQWRERLRLHRPERLQGPRMLYTSGRAQRAERHHRGRNIVTR